MSMKNSLVVLVPVLLFGFSSSVQSAEWKERKPTGDNNYSAEYEWEDCRVRVRADGTGVETITWEDSIHGVITQFESIKNGKLAERDSRRHESGGVIVQGPRLHLFHIKCKEAAKDLPPETKEAFRGFYRLK
jgi:hypothetical protein